MGVRRAFEPAVTLGLVLTGATSWSTVPFYLLGEFSGAIVGGVARLCGV